MPLGIIKSGMVYDVSNGAKYVIANPGTKKEKYKPPVEGTIVTYKQANEAGKVIIIDSDLVIVKQRGYATGDMFAISAALVIHQNFYVIIDYNYDDPKDSAETIINFYHQILERLGCKDYTFRATLYVTNQYVSEKDVVNSMINSTGNIGISSAQLTQLIQPVSSATKLIAYKNFNAAHIDLLKRAWGVGTKTDDQIYIWLMKKGIELVNSKIIILWSRLSGIRGGAHLEHDTHFEALNQLGRHLKAEGVEVIICGDGELTTADINNTLKFYNLVEFWKNDKDFSSYESQFSIFDYLYRLSHGSLIHIGMRSGMLEAMALLGHKVFYMEEKGSLGSERMLSWKALDGVQYNRIELNNLPTAIGKHIQTNFPEGTAEKKEEYKELVSNIRDGGKKIDTKLLNQFSIDDLKKISGHLNFRASSSSLYKKLGVIEKKIEEDDYGDFEVVDVEGDGNCFFHAVAAQLKLHFCIVIDHVALRAQAIEYMILNIARYKNILEQKADAFIDENSTVGAWADNEIIDALVRALNETGHDIRIRIIRSNRTENIIGEGSTVLNLGYREGLHYVSLITVGFHSRGRRL